jgi:RNA 3'-terminal phosphate cyclase
MSLYIEVYVGNPNNRKMVARSHVYNVSNLADISNYEFISTEFGNEQLGILPSEIKGDITEHERKSSVWNLVRKVAGMSC